MNREALDELVPLETGSFGDVVDIGVDIPFRYAECYVTLDDGRKARLKDRRQLVGWSGREGRRAYYFRDGNALLCVRTNSAYRLPVRTVERWERCRTVSALSPRDSRVVSLGTRIHKITTVDGGLLFLAPAVKEAAAAAIRRAPFLKTGQPALA